MATASAVWPALSGPKSSKTFAHGLAGGGGGGALKLPSAFTATVPGDWYFQGNHRISSFDSAFPELRTVDGQLEILDNDQLVTFGETPFSNFENVQHLYCTYA